ncbi:MAG: ATP-binding protein, partial [Muribaculaceae bacterium]
HDAISNDIVKEDRAMIENIIKEKEINFYIDNYQAIGFVYTFKDKEYIITASAYDGYGYTNRNMLWEWLILFVLLALIIVVVIGYLFAKSALIPIRDISKKAEEITATQINKRLPVKNEKDELGELSVAFNALLERLEKSFKSQKMFVSNVSHELRTPMAALITQLDISLLKERTADEYKLAINDALSDANRVVKLINGLLDLVKSDYEQEQIKMSNIRLDELLIDSIDLVLKAHNDYHVELIFEQEADDDSVITISANIYLLTIALVNLIENNCKYSSNHTSLIQISYWEEHTIVRFSDNGVGMSENDKKKIFQLFYRGENKGDVAGHGIGMALTQKIISLHKGEISVYSKEGEGTTFLIRLPHV